MYKVVFLKVETKIQKWGLISTIINLGDVNFALKKINSLINYFINVLSITLRLILYHCSQFTVNHKTK